VRPDVTADDVAGAVERVADWLEATDGLDAARIHPPAFPPPPP
jgi:hypothetical protein